MLGERRDYSRQRQSVIAANAELRERELIKMASLCRGRSPTACAAAASPTRSASLAAEAGIAVFRVAFERWVSGPPTRKLLDDDPRLARSGQSADAAD